jgi:hypothetical protein
MTFATMITKAISHDDREEHEGCSGFLDVGIIGTFVIVVFFVAEPS